MPRITRKDLDGLVARVNAIAGTPAEPYTRTATGEYVANAGNYHLSGAYGGWALHQMCEGGGTRDVLYSGHVPARELFGMVDAFARGYYAACAERPEFATD